MSCFAPFAFFADPVSCLGSGLAPCTDSCDLLVRDPSLDVPACLGIGRHQCVQAVRRDGGERGQASSTSAGMDRKATRP